MVVLVVEMVAEERTASAVWERMAEAGWTEVGSSGEDVEEVMEVMERY